MGTILATVVVIVHASAAFLAIVMGPVNMIRRRRDAFHRLVGRTWVSFMYATCLSGLFITENGITLFHALALFTIGTVTLALWRIRRGDPFGHAANMIGSYIGLLIAFGFAALLPARLIQQTATDTPLGLAVYAVALVGALGGWVLLLRWFTARAAKHSATLGQWQRRQHQGHRDSSELTPSEPSPL